VALGKVIDLVFTTCVVFSTNKALVYALRETKQEREWSGEEKKRVEW